MPTEAEIAWAAGIVDGEGCITISRQKPGARQVSVSYRLALKVTMGHRATVERLGELFRAGSIQVQYSTKGHNDAWSWWVANRQAIDVLSQLRPYLFTKAVEADLAFEWGRIPLSPRGSRPGRVGGQVVPPEILAERHRLFEALRDAKPSARFRVAVLDEEAGDG